MFPLLFGYSGTVWILLSHRLYMCLCCAAAVIACKCLFAFSTTHASSAPEAVWCSVACLALFTYQIGMLAGLHTPQAAQTCFAAKSCTGVTSVSSDFVCCTLARLWLIRRARRQLSKLRALHRRHPGDDTIC